MRRALYVEADEKSDKLLFIKCVIIMIKNLYLSNKNEPNVVTLDKFWAFFLLHFACNVLFTVALSEICILVIDRAPERKMTRAKFHRRRSVAIVLWTRTNWARKLGPFCTRWRRTIRTHPPVFRRPIWERSLTFSQSFIRATLAPKICRRSWRKHRRTPSRRVGWVSGCARCTTRWTPSLVNQNSTALWWIRGGETDGWTVPAISLRRREYPGWMFQFEPLHQVEFVVPWANSLYSRI